MLNISDNECEDISEVSIADLIGIELRRHIPELEKIRERYRLSDLQYRFALARVSGCNATQAARLAGYQGGEDVNGSQLRSQASKANKSSKIQAFIAEAQALIGGTEDAVLTVKERKRILSRIARGADPARSKDAILALQKIEAEEKLVRAESPEREPHVVLTELAAEDDLGVVLAILLAEKHGVDWRPSVDQTKAANRFLDQLATDRNAGFAIVN